MYRLISVRLNIFLVSIVQMPLKCCVTGCRSNYENEKGYVSVFKFPTDENMKRIWMEKIRRKDWTPGPNARVCELHFQSKFISKVEEYVDEDGSRKAFPRKRPVLSGDAIPTQFPSVSYFSERKNSEKRRKVVVVKENREKTTDQFLSGNVLPTFHELISSCARYKLKFRSWSWFSSTCGRLRGCLTNTRMRKNRYEKEFCRLLE